MKARIITIFIMAVGRLLARMSDRGMLRLFTIVRRIVPDPAMRDGLDEFIDAIRLGPPNTTLIRRMLTESRYEELCDFIEQEFFPGRFDPEEIMKGNG